MSRTKRNAHEGMYEHVKACFARGHSGRGIIRDNRTKYGRTNDKWLDQTCVKASVKKFLKQKRTKSERQLLKGQTSNAYRDNH